MMTNKLSFRLFLGYPSQVWLNHILQVRQTVHLWYVVVGAEICGWMIDDYLSLFRVDYHHRHTWTWDGLHVEPFWFFKCINKRVRSAVLS